MIARLRAVATHPAARGLLDDAAVLDPPLGQQLVATHDVLVEGVHYTSGCPPRDVAWKLLAVNLSDLAAMGARPAGVLAGVALPAATDDAWIEDFIDGLGHACARFGAPLLGGDTVRGGDVAVLGMTALGFVPAGAALGRVSARPGDRLWVSGTLGDAALGLRIALGDAAPHAELLARYRRPSPRLAMGLALRGIASAAMDVSDGLLLDARRLAAASGVALEVWLADMPLSDAARERLGVDDDALLAAATGGDDYELLFTAPSAADARVRAAAGAAGVAVSPIGLTSEGEGLRVIGSTGDALYPRRLGYEH